MQQPYPKAILNDHASRGSRKNSLRFQWTRIWRGARHRMLVAAQPVDPLGNSGRDLRLVLCDLLRDHAPDRRNEMIAMAR